MLIGFGGSCPYIVGDIIHSESSAFDPNKTYLGTTWSRIKGRVITGVDEAQTEFSSPKMLGGVKTINATHNHTTGSLALTIAQLPQHNHSIGNTWSPGRAGESVKLSVHFNAGTTYGIEWYDAISTTTGNGQVHNHGNTGNAGNALQSNLQPYVTKFIWERIS